MADEERFIRVGESGMLQILEELKHLRQQRDELQKRGTELVTENRRLREALKLDPRKYFEVAAAKNPPTTEEVLKEDEIYMCAACGRLSVDRMGKNPVHDGWDESCYMHAVKVSRKDLQYGRDGRAIAAIARGEG